MGMTVPSITNSIMATYKIQPINIEAKNSRSTGRERGRGEKKRRVIRERPGKMIKRVRSKGIGPIKVKQTSIKSGPATSKTHLIVTPSKMRAREITVNQVIKLNKISKKSSFTIIVSKCATFMLEPVENSVKVSQDEPGDM